MRKGSPTKPRRCYGCGKSFNSLGAVGRHAQLDPSCTPEMKFWGKVNKNGPGGCWIWMGYTHKFGHGWIGAKPQGVLAHRRGWEMTRGPIPEGMFVLHKCDVPACVNPDHLYIGDRADNSADSVARHRHSFGTRTGTSKLTDEQVRAIRAKYRKLSPRRSNIPELMAEYDVTQGCIWGIVNGKSWRHLL